VLPENSKVKAQNQNPKVKTELRERCYNYSIEIIKYIDALPSKRINWVLSNQLLRSATSVGANVIEAKSASSKKDFIRYYEIALKSANETRYWLSLVRDTADTDGVETKHLLNETEELSKIIAASLLTMKNKR
jgi:four helix bundle protein